MRISDWSSDVCSSDLVHSVRQRALIRRFGQRQQLLHLGLELRFDLLRVPIRERAVPRSEERRVGKECVSTCRSRWSLCLYKEKIGTSTRSIRYLTTKHE